jgi:AraC-like DNA-binding protein
VNTPGYPLTRCRSLIASAARRLLEAGRTIAETAAATGFADQSHLHRHLRRGLGVTPLDYQRRFARVDHVDPVVRERNDAGAAS